MDGVQFSSAEQYFQYAKCTSERDKKAVLETTSGMDSWSVGHRVRLRPDWEIVKVREMYTGNKARLTQHPEDAAPLIASKGSITFTSSTPFWYEDFSMGLNRVFRVPLVFSKYPG